MAVFAVCPIENAAPPVQGGEILAQSYEVAVPSVIKADIRRGVEGLVQLAYPNVDEKWISNAVADVFSKGTDTVSVARAPGSKFRFDGVSLQVGGQMPRGELWAVFKDVPIGNFPGTETDASFDACMKKASDILAKAVPNADWRSRLTLTETNAVGEYAFVWEEKPGYMFGEAPQKVRVSFRKDNGMVTSLLLRPRPEAIFGAPTLTRAQALEKAKALPGRIDEKNLSLSIRCYYAERRLVWQYMPPPNPSAGVLQRDYGIWDAMTGDLLESDRLNGAKPEYNTYRNPEFYFEPTEANVKANLEKNLKKWAEELESKAKAAKAAEAKPPEGK
jgi:hypothetical protein